MSFLDRLLGTSKPVASKTEALFAMTTAVITLQTSLHLEPSNAAALCFKAIDVGRFEELKQDIEALLKIRAADTKSTMSTMTDTYGYQWIILQTEQFEDLVTTIHLMSEELKSRGFGEQLLSSVFKFTGDGRNVYWIYNYKRGTFYPMVPTGGQTRDNAFELRLKTLMERELPIEPELERWYSLWGSPV
ncbi:MAG TPA: hypothetical protein VIJ28_11785 [Chloroflexota bacterium]